jgi:hypothetical protein
MNSSMTANRQKLRAVESDLSKTMSPSEISVELEEFLESTAEFSPEHHLNIT